MLLSYLVSSFNCWDDTWILRSVILLIKSAYLFSLKEILDLIWSTYLSKLAEFIFNLSLSAKIFLILRSSSAISPWTYLTRDWDFKRKSWVSLTLLIKLTRSAWALMSLSWSYWMKPSSFLIYVLSEVSWLPAFSIYLFKSVNSFLKLLILSSKGEVSTLAVLKSVYASCNLANDLLSWIFKDEMLNPLI